MALSARTALGMLGVGWARGLRPASFRGVQFFIESYGVTYGRRGPDHQYPGRDVPFAEDLGRAQRIYRFTGYCIGDSYTSDRDRLIKACEQAGPGELVHPTIGTVDVVCRSCSVTEERERGRYCAFEFEFHEAGQLREPAEEPDADLAVENAAAPVGTTASSSFLSKFSTAGATSWLEDSAVSDIRGLAQTLQQLRLPAPTAPQSALGQALGYLTNNASSLAGHPDMLASRVDSAFGAFTDAGEALPVVSAMLRFVLPQANLASLLPFTGRALHTGVNLPITIRRANNKKAFDEFTYRLALREIGYAVTGVELDNYQQAQAMLAELSTAFAQIENEAADAGDDEVYTALINLRASIIRMLGARALDLNPMITYRITSATPANSLTLAWRLYQDSGREDEIVRRVRARNPAFLPMTGRVLAA